MLTTEEMMADNVRRLKAVYNDAARVASDAKYKEMKAWREYEAALRLKVSMREKSEEV